jgi:Colicin V production protein
MPTFLTILIMLGLAYVFMVQGMATAFAMFCNVFLAGLIAFNFWEPLADVLEPVLSKSFFAGFEDAICLTALFSIAFALLRLATNTLSGAVIEFHPIAQSAGGAFIGLVTGFFLAGFLVTVLQTLPWHQSFWGYEPNWQTNRSGLDDLFPPDRVWLALMHRAGENGFGRSGHSTFDPEATFVLRYTRFRRYDDRREVLPYNGEFDRELHPSLMADADPEKQR